MFLFKLLKYTIYIFHVSRSAQPLPDLRCKSTEENKKILMHSRIKSRTPKRFLTIARRTQHTHYPEHIHYSPEIMPLSSLSTFIHNIRLTITHQKDGHFQITRSFVHTHTHWRIEAHLKPRPLVSLLRCHCTIDFIRITLFCLRTHTHTHSRRSRNSEVLHLIKKSPYTAGTTHPRDADAHTNPSGLLAAQAQRSPSRTITHTPLTHTG